jgi:hypothetical protein
VCLSCRTNRYRPPDQRFKSGSGLGQGHFGNLPNIFFGLALVAQCLTQLFCTWGRARLWIKNAGSRRRYFEQLSIMISRTAIDDDGIPILYCKYCKFEFGDTS